LVSTIGKLRCPAPGLGRPIDARSCEVWQRVPGPPDWVAGLVVSTDGGPVVPGSLDAGPVGGLAVSVAAGEVVVPPVPAGVCTAPVESQQRDGADEGSRPV